MPDPPPPDITPQGAAMPDRLYRCRCGRAQPCRHHGIEEEETTVSTDTVPATEFNDPETIDVHEVMANINHAWKMRGHRWTTDPCWPNITVKAMADHIAEVEQVSERRRRELEFIEVLCDGGNLTVNGIPWREAFERFNAIFSDPV